MYGPTQASISYYKTLFHWPLKQVFSLFPLLLPLSLIFTSEKGSYLVVWVPILWMPSWKIYFSTYLHLLSWPIYFLFTWHCKIHCLLDFSSFEYFQMCRFLSPPVSTKQILCVWIIIFHFSSYIFLYLFWELFLSIMSPLILHY